VLRVGVGVGVLVLLVLVLGVVACCLLLVAQWVGLIGD
jgi:hypothetical protein